METGHPSQFPVPQCNSKIGDSFATVRWLPYSPDPPHDTTVPVSEVRSPNTWYSASAALAVQRCGSRDARVPSRPDF